MDSEKKKNHTKALIIALIVLAVVLAVGGIALILQQPHNGAEAALSSASVLEDDIRASTTSLTDDEFEYGIDNIIPKSTTEISVLKSECRRIEAYYSDTFQITSTTEILNFFGTDALRLTLKNVEDLSQILTPLKDSGVFKRIHILLVASDTGLEYAEYLYDNGNVYTLYEPHDLMVSEPSSEIKYLAEMLSQKYELPVETMQCADSEFKVDLGNLAASDVISVFDDCWQYLLDKQPGVYLTLCNGDILLASAKVERDQNYTRYYPDNDLAPLFRLTFYYQNNFFKNSIHSMCQLYL